MNRVTVLFFAILRDQAGTKMIEAELQPGANVRDLKNAVVARFPVMKEAIERCLVSINHEYSEDEAEVPPAAEVAFFPPVSGGSDIRH